MLKRKSIIFIIVVFLIIISFFIGIYSASIKNISRCKSQELFDSKRTYLICKTVNLKKLNTKEKKEILGNVIKETIDKDFNSKDYNLEIIETKTDDEVIEKYYDLIFTIEGAKTILGYSARVDGKDKLIEIIFDNMNGYNQAELKKENEKMIKIKLKSLTDERLKEIRKKALEKPDNSIVSRVISKEYVYFEVETKKLYYILDIDLNLIGDKNAPPTSVVDYREEI